MPRERVGSGESATEWIITLATSSAMVVTRGLSTNCAMAMTDAYARVADEQGLSSRIAQNMSLQGLAIRYCTV